MGDADGGIPFCKKLAECLIDERLRFSIKCAWCLLLAAEVEQYEMRLTCGFIKNEDVRLFDKGSCYCNALFLAPRKLSTSRADMSFKAIRLY